MDDQTQAPTNTQAGSDNATPAANPGMPAPMSDDHSAMPAGHDDMAAGVGHAAATAMPRAGSAPTAAPAQAAPAAPTGGQMLPSGPSAAMPAPSPMPMGSAMPPAPAPVVPAPMAAPKPMLDPMAAAPSAAPMSAAPAASPTMPTPVAAATSTPVAPAAPIATPTPSMDEVPTPGISPADNSVELPGKKGAKILVVEDEIDARTMFVDLLSSEGYETSSAVDGVDALAKAAADKFHLILLDIVMPNKDGIEVLQEIKNSPDKYGTPVVVMLTNISGDAAIEKAMELGAAGFRLKVDTEPAQLLKDIQDFLGGKIQDVEAEPVSRSLT